MGSGDGSASTLPRESAARLDWVAPAVRDARAAKAAQPDEDTRREREATTDRDDPERTQASEPKRARLLSVDALRGFDMFWLLGAKPLVHALRQLQDLPFLQSVAYQLEHVAWEGFHFYDLIFPLFLFLVGVSIVLSLDRIRREQGLRPVLWRIARRSVLLYALGVFYYGALSHDGGPEMLRWVGELQRIAICYAVGSVLHLLCSRRALYLGCVLILLGYWALLTWVPVPGHGAGDFSQGANLANWVDRVLLPGYKWNGDWDPQGLLSTLPAIASTVFGILAAGILTDRSRSTLRRLATLTLCGLACLLVGWLWSFQFPVIKKIWTSSFVLVAAGWSFLLLAAFHLLLDVQRWKFWARPFVWIGCNAIALYMLVNLLDGGFVGLVRRVLHRPFTEATAPWGELLVAVLATALPLYVAWWLHRRKIFIRI